MTFNLVEDPETFEAVLDFVDRFIVTDTASRQSTDGDAALTLAMDGLPEMAPQVETESDPGETAPAAKISAKEKANDSSTTTKSKPKRKLKYNPNRAREQQRKELQYLREKVVKMEQEHKALQEQKTLPNVGVNGNNPEGEEVALFRAPGVWKEMASHQLEQRLKSERENRRLKALLEKQIKVDNTLAKLLEAKLFIRFVGILLYFVLQPMDTCAYGSQRIRRMHTPAPDRTSPAIFAELLSSVDDSFREVDEVFKANVLGEMESSFSDAKMRVGPDGVYMEMFANKVLPFDVASTGTAAWKFFANLIEHMPFRFFYQKDSQNLEPTGDTIFESFGVGSHASGMQADFRVKQILRHYVVEDRVVIVWRSFIDLVEFSGVALRGAEFREKGYVVVRRPRGMAENFALLQTCYLIHPNTPVHSLSDDGTIASTLTDIILSGTAAKIATGYQTIENILFNEAMKTHSRV